MSMIIREPIAADEADWRGLWHNYNVFYERVASVANEATDQTWNRLICPDVAPFGFVAELDGQITGFTHYWFEQSTAKVGQRIYLQDLFVDPSARGRGHGKALIEAVYAAAQSANAYEVFWLTQKFNYAARKLYDEMATETPFIKYSYTPNQ